MAGKSCTVGLCSSSSFFLSSEPKVPLTDKNINGKKKPAKKNNSLAITDDTVDEGVAPPESVPKDINAPKKQKAATQKNTGTTTMTTTVPATAAVKKRNTVHQEIVEEGTSFCFDFVLQPSDHFLQDRGLP